METIIESVLHGKLESSIIQKWLNNEPIEEASEDCILLCCSRKEFVSYFLSFLRSQTDRILQTNTTTLQILQHQGTPERSPTPRKHHRSISDPTREADRTTESLSVKNDIHRSYESPNRDKKKIKRKVKTKLFPDDKSKDCNASVSSDESRLNSGIDRLTLSSTPLKNGIKFSEYPNLPHSSPVTSHVKSFNYERCDTPRLSHRHSRSQDKNVSLGDYLVNVQTKSTKKKRSSKNASIEDNEVKIELDLNNSEVFPEIGARKSSSLRSERRRIKPTSIGSTSQKSFSLNSFNSDTFQQPSPLAFQDNLAFQPTIQPKESSNNFEAERNILKQERHKLMEKFNILNTSTALTLAPTPQIKITQKEFIDNDQKFVIVDSSKIIFKDKIDILVELYNIMIKNNLVLSINTEIYFLISILLSKQCEEDYVSIESQLNDNLLNSILKSINNSTYFAVRSLWNQRLSLEVILDKNSLKTLGENKRVRNFSPDLAKFLLNAYGLKCEAESIIDKSKACENNGRTSNGIVCFNFETDNAENFSSALSFHDFKKQRDMFYEILRWYNESPSASKSTFRARVKTLLSVGPTASNNAHLAALFTAHMVSECLVIRSQESKLSKLQRRLTSPSAPESHRLPRFTSKEVFYKEFILHADNDSFRVHLRDALASEIVALDSTPLGTEALNAMDPSQGYLQLSKKLSLLSRFLGYSASLPYSQQAALRTSVAREHLVPPKEKVLANNVALRNYSQPSIDLQALLTSAYENGRLCITLPWIVNYLSMVDYTTLRLRYYQNLAKTLFYIYNSLNLTDTLYKKNTVIFLKSNLGWLFDLPHFPQELFYEENNFKLRPPNENIDYCDLIDESILFELCPFLKDLTVLLTTSRVSQEQKEMGSFRHITPVSLGVNPEDRIRNKEKELQARLEEAFLKSQPSSTRRVLDLVVERVAAGVVKQLSVETVAAARARARAKAAEIVRTGDRGNLLQSLEAMYARELQALHAEATRAGAAQARVRVRGALGALLPAAPAPLRAVAVERADRAIARWLRDHATREILCKDVKVEMKALLAAGEATPTSKTPPVQLTSSAMDCTSPANALIALKELICVLLEDEEPVQEPSQVLSMCAACCSPLNMFCRPPTQRAILQLSVDYCIVYVSRKPKHVTEAFLTSLENIWRVCCPERRRSPETPPSPPLERDGTGRPEEGAKTESQDPVNDEQLEFFDRILCARNIVLLSDTKCSASDVWEAMGSVLVFLLKHDYLDEDSLTEQCLAVYRQDWPQNILESLSTCMKAVSSRWSRASAGKFNLFLDFLAEYCGDMEYERMMD